MKTLSIITSVIAIGCLFANSQQTEAPRYTAQVTIRADAKTVKPEKEPRQENDKKKDNTKSKSETVTKTLEVEISAAKSINGPLKMVTMWVARDLTSKDQVIAKTEESEVALDAAKTAKATVPSYAFVSLSASSKKDAKGKTERTDASGQTYGGWVIRVYEGPTLVGEAASSPLLLKLQK